MKLRFARRKLDNSSAFLSVWGQPVITCRARSIALEFVSRYNVGPHDAANLASAQFAGVLDLASFDRGYRRVDGLFLWNDRIYGD